MMNLRHIDNVIAAREEELDALRKAREILDAAAPRPAKKQMKLLPAPKTHKTPKAAKPSRAANDDGPAVATVEIAGVEVRMTEQQQAFVELLDAHDYMGKALYLPLFDNNVARAKAAIVNLRDRLAAAKVTAKITGYKRQGFRLEVAE